MTDLAAPSRLVGSALADLDRLRKSLASVRAAQLFAIEPRGHVKAVALSWFDNYRAMIVSNSSADLAAVDGGYKDLLSASERASSTSKVRRVVKALRANLVSLQTTIVSSPAVRRGANNAAPSFGAIPDPHMRQVLTRRWLECVACLDAGAPLAATVMMGGLLESLFLARVNREPNKKVVFTAATAPKDASSGNPLSLKDWTLNDYIAVAHELKWITQAAREVSQVVRDYRNYIHPQKELAHQLSLSVPDARMFWEVSKAIAVQLV